MGYVSWVGKYATEDSVIVTLLYKAGAVFYVKTSVPQALMICETINNVIGRTVNPRNKDLSPGGSSGGEGAMVGFRGGVIGVGTDLGKWSGNCDESYFKQDQVEVFGSLQPSIFFMVSDLPMEDFRTQKWQSKCRSTLGRYINVMKLYGRPGDSTKCVWTAHAFY
jgi:hypothetical protein